MKNRVTVVATLLGLSLLGFARAESLNSKLAALVAASAGESKGTSEEQSADVPVDDAERHVLDAEARDAANRALDNAHDERK